MKKIFRVSLIILSFILVGVMTLLLVIFFKPDLIINTKFLKYGIEKSSMFKKFSWDKGALSVEWKSWNNRNFSGHFENLCFEYLSPGVDVASCLEKLSWNFDIGFSLEKGVHAYSNEPFLLRSELVNVKTRKLQEKVPQSAPPDIRKYWQMLWSDLVPDIDVKITQIKIQGEGGPQSLDLSLIKTPEKLMVTTMELKLNADPEKLVVLGPSTYKVPGGQKLKKPLELKKIKLTAFMNKKDGIPLDLSGEMDGITINFDSFIDLPLKGDFSSAEFRKNAFLKTRGRLFLGDLQRAVKTYAPAPYDALPAPLNVMNGTIELLLHTSGLEQDELVQVHTETVLKLKGKKQVLDVSLVADIPLNVMNFSRGLIQIGVDFSKVVIQLPRLSKKSPPPQFFPDGRFKSSKEVSKKSSENKSDIAFDLEALNSKALHIKSNLLDEALRLNFDIKVREGDVKTGFLKVLPLKTTVFKRPIRVRDLLIEFNHPLDPVISSTIQFPLPEYKITLDLEGPVSDPRYTFSSEPPLPKNDIYAVLLFGRPLADLGPDDKNATRQTNKILSQGILSLSVLYFLSGSPVEYIGYDPDTGRGTAQIGINNKTSLKVGAGEGGGSTGVRRSLGKGWYLDTSVQRNSDPASDDARDYGVLLERIIAY